MYAWTDNWTGEWLSRTGENQIHTQLHWHSPCLKPCRTLDAGNVEVSFGNSNLLKQTESWSQSTEAVRTKLTMPDSPSCKVSSDTLCLADYSAVTSILIRGNHCVKILEFRSQEFFYSTGCKSGVINFCIYRQSYWISYDFLNFTKYTTNDDLNSISR